MSDFKLNILGCGSATPSARHCPSSQVIERRGRIMMVDCGEGTQVNLRRMSLKFNRMTDIFISHLHGDHVFGLPGMLASFALHQKGGRITIHTTEEGVSVLRPTLDFFCRETPFEIVFRPFDAYASEVIYEDKSLTVNTFPLYHRVPCTGFLFREKPGELRYLPEVGEVHGVPVKAIPGIKQGNDFVRDDGRVIPNKVLTADPPAPLSYAYCSDTMFDKRVAKSVEGVDVIYHEATYDSSFAEIARKRGHSTAAEAATIAKMAGVKALILGHFSKRYKDEQILLDEASEIFPNTWLADELRTFDIEKTAMASQ